MKIGHKEYYKLFSGHTFYPLGGYEDFINEFENLEDAKMAADLMCVEDCFIWAHIVYNNKIVLVGTHEDFGMCNLPSVLNWDLPND